MLNALVLLLQVLASIQQQQQQPRHNIVRVQWDTNRPQPPNHQLLATVARFLQQQQPQAQQGIAVRRQSQFVKDDSNIVLVPDQSASLVRPFIALYNLSLPNVLPPSPSSSVTNEDQNKRKQHQQLGISLPQPQYLPRIAHKKKRAKHRAQKMKKPSLLSNLTTLIELSDESSNAIELDRTAPDSFFTKTLENVVRLLPPMRIGQRQNPGCVGGTKCQFFVFCWMSGGSLGASCGPLHTCCVTPSSQEIQPTYYGPVINDPQCGKSAARLSRIVGGSDASFGQFPWQAFVQVGGSRCGGAIVGPAHVVTAGHCVARSQHNPSSIRVTLGDYILHSEIESLPHEVFTVSEVKLHPNFRFTPQADRYDVAVLVLDRSVQYRENIMPICLPPKGANYLGRMAYVAGWGALQAGSKLRPKVLQHVNVPVIDNPICEGWHKQRGINIKIYDEMLCAGYETGGLDACQGDSGGPLMLNEFGVWYLIGIVSAGYSCAKQYQPGIYHRLSSSSDWVSANVFPSSSSSTRFQSPSP